MFLMTELAKRVALVVTFGVLVIAVCLLSGTQAQAACDCGCEQGHVCTCGETSVVRRVEKQTTMGRHYRVREMRLVRSHAVPVQTTFTAAPPTVVLMAEGLTAHPPTTVSASRVRVRSRRGVVTHIQTWE